METKFTLNNEIKKTNRSRIFNLLYKKDALSKRDFQLQLDLSLPTITQKLNELLQEGLIEHNEPIGNTGGRNAATYSIAENARLAVGLDITKNHVTAVVINLHGEVVAQLRNRLPFERSDPYMKCLGEIVNRIITENSIDPSRILGVGIGLPGLTNAANDRVVYGKILDILDMTSQDFSQYIPFPVRIFNDANAACDIELYNINDINSNGFYIMLSNNVGGAVFINGSVYVGDNFRSGEIGHLNIHPGGLRCYCGQHGCVDPYCSATVLTAVSNDNLEQFFTLLGNQDSTARSIWSAYLEHLALAVRNVRILYDCPVIIGGYVGAYMEKYLDELKTILDNYNSFDQNSDYVVACKYKTEAIAAGAALSFIKAFLATI